MSIKPQDVDALLELFESSEWNEMQLKIQDFELFLSTDPNSRSPGAGLAAQGVAALDAAAAPAAVGGNAGGGTTMPSVQTQPHWVAVTAPNLGTFYRAPKPGSPPFIEIGQAVDPETEICLIEVMKLFTTLKAGVKGIVKQVCVQDAAMVEFGETLFYIEPA